MKSRQPALGFILITFFLDVLGVGLIGIAWPTAQGLVSRAVPVNEQGLVQGSLTSLGSLTGIIGTPIGTTTFGYFIGPAAVVRLPGAAFFLGSGLIFGALLLALRSFRRQDRPAENTPRVGTPEPASNVP